MKRSKLGMVILLLLVIGICSMTLGKAWGAEAQNIEIKNGRVYLNLKNADVKSVLQIFAKATGTNIVAANDVTGKVSVTFTGINPKAGLEAVLRTIGLDWFEESGTIFVSTKKIMRSYFLENAKPSDLAETIKTILPTGSTVTADDSYNVLVIQTTSDYLPRLEKLIGELDVLPTQVMVEAKIIEVDLGNGANAGLDVNYKKNNSNDNVQTLNLAGRPTDATVPGLNTSTAQGLYAHVLSIFSTASLEAFLSALSTSNKTNVVAAPKITTLNNKEASILIGAKFGYKTSVISQTSTTQVVNFLEVGTSLTMTPNVTKNGYIRMKVAPKVSDGIVVNDLPQENTTETKNEVMVKDGQTFVIGGLVKQKDTTFDYGVPFLMDIPILGALFRKSVTNSSKTELLIFVTPHILTAEYLDSIDLPTKEFVEKNERYKARLIH